MNRALVTKGIGSALVISGLILLTTKILSIPEAEQTWSSWASPESGTAWLFGALALEGAFLASRLALGYLVFKGSKIGAWAFYPLALLTAVSGLSGLVLVTLVVVLRFWPGEANAAET